MSSLQVGVLVDHAVWGKGKVLALRAPNAQAYFPALEPDAGGPVRLVQASMLKLSEVQSDPRLDAVSTKSAAGAKPGARVRRPPKRPDNNLAKALEWFAEEYPGRFSDPRLITDEIKPKRDAHQLFADRLGNGAGRELLKSGNSAEVGTLLDALYHSTNIPSRFEVAAVRDGLTAPDAAARLLDTLLAFLDSADPFRFSELVGAVGSLPAPAKTSRVLTWPNVTLLPFLADPARFIVTKPEITKQAAGRMEIDLLYSTAVKWDTYQRVLDMSHRLLEALKPIGASDFIDVQSFVWVTRRLR
jgi:hypothetical protein